MHAMEAQVTLHMWADLIESFILFYLIIFVGYVRVAEIRP